MEIIQKLTLTTLVIASLAGCSNQQTEPMSHAVGIIPACPSSPNCVSSDAQDKTHRIAPFIYISSTEQAWLTTRQVVSALPRSKVIEETDTYIHLEVRSAFFRFTDDLKLQLRPADNLIAVYSASRTGYSDFGVNGERVEAIRQSLIAQDIIK